MINDGLGYLEKITYNRVIFALRKMLSVNEFQDFVIRQIGKLDTLTLHMFIMMSSSNTVIVCNYSIMRKPLGDVMEYAFH